MKGIIPVTPLKRQTELATDMKSITIQFAFRILLPATNRMDLMVLHR
jgi:hypothetical protein